ncbi:MAG TPA: hypothetical protein P5234_11315 [Thermoanaerobaculaceae bacterium]|nr:hypothetical protein [Thermoanaerobaculaceae bacterium]HRS16819.1 hypothetical protein [Thermoanaerobaculaceae bacterium]
MKVHRRIVEFGVALVVLAGSAARGDELAARLKQRVGEVLAGERPLAEVRLELVWSKPDRRALLVLGSGVGVWNLERQFKASEKDVRAALEILRGGGYFEMDEQPRPNRAAGRQPQGPRVLRAVVLRVGDLERSVSQTDRVEPLPALETMMGEVFKLFEKTAAKGVEAASLEDGLTKVASGALAPEVLEVVVNQPPVPAAAGNPAEDGLILVVREGVVTMTVQPANGEPLREVRQAVPAERLRGLAKAAREAGVAAMPVNLYRQRYADVKVAVLRQGVQVQARQFAGMDPGAHRVQQEALERFIGAVLALRGSTGGGE